MFKKSFLCAIITFSGAQFASSQPAEPDALNGADAATYIRSALPLDEPRHLCIDIPGHGDAVELDGEFIVHTCKDGMWNLDQRFQWSVDRSELEMPQYAKCLAVNHPSAGSPIVLSDCGSPMTGWTSQGARLKFESDPSLCITIADGPSVLTPFAAKFPAHYLVRDLTLEVCSDAAFERQLWSVAQPLDLESILLPPSGSWQVN
ncbi:RICIN domain-containing protein [uncultured Tateyamaria sp.]|uniref:RICIN domain-containing protein n=1 Tax=uncultured Tateyamaria sp. TaxID=455651 RepID=UPI00261E8349|nr:RICIN domain-containing protein [uncultured Tateyamaria sp.]